MLPIILKKGGLSLTEFTSVGVGSGATAKAGLETGKVQANVDCRRADLGPRANKTPISNLLIPFG